MRSPFLQTAFCTIIDASSLDIYLIFYYPGASFRRFKKICSVALHVLYTITKSSASSRPLLLAKSSKESNVRHIALLDVFSHLFKLSHYIILIIISSSPEIYGFFRACPRLLPVETKDEMEYSRSFKLRQQSALSLLQQSLLIHIFCHHPARFLLQGLRLLS